MVADPTRYIFGFTGQTRAQTGILTKHARSSVPFSESHAQTRSVPSSFMLTLPTCCPRVRLIQRFEFCHRKTETLRVQEQLTIFACASPPHAHPARVPLRFQKAKQKPARHGYRFTAPEPSRPSCPKSGYVPVNCAHPQLSPHASECAVWSISQGRQWCELRHQHSIHWHGKRPDSRRGRSCSPVSTGRRM